MGSNSENSRQVISLSLIQLKQTQTKMLRFAVLFVAAACSAIPIEDTPEVAEAKAAHLALVEEAKAGLHAAKAPVNNDVQAEQIATAYLADDEAVAAAKAVAAPIAVAGYPYAAYPYAAYPYAAYPYAHHG